MHLYLMHLSYHSYKLPAHQLLLLMRFDCQILLLNMPD